MAEGEASAAALAATVRAGAPAPLGATVTGRGVNFALRAPAATAVWLALWPDRRQGPRHDLALGHRSGEVWHVEVEGVAPPLEWAWRVDRPAAPAGPPPDPQRLLLDPYARAVTGAERWGEPASERRCFLGVAHGAAGEPPRYAPTERVVYELCVRGFTAHRSSGVTDPGTLRGLREKVPYLAELGITTVELLPIAEWDELEPRARNPATGEALRNLWGYSPIVFSAPKAGLAADRSPGAAVAELRELVEALHVAGIEVLLDVVFNHTAERDGLAGDPVFSFGGFDPAGCYLVDAARGRYRDATGCGNTVAANQPAMVELIVDALRWWVAEIGVDGFRFDLAAALLRGEDGEPLADPPLLRRIESEPLLADRVLIAEPWDAGGLYLGGAFARHGRGDGGNGWAEWNDKFRDDVRRFVRGEPGLTRALAARLAGSPDLFAAAPRGPAHSINYVTCHDGFTLADLVAYDRKHNEANGENNRDGSDWNASWNCGVEGPTGDPQVLALRRRQVRNLLTLLFVARGVPMLLAGDERGNTQRGNNNAWCQDNEVGWLDWSRDDEGLLRFTRGLIALRRAHPVLRRGTFLAGESSGAPDRGDVVWHGAQLGSPDWGADANTLAMHLAGAHASEPDDDFYLAANAGSAPVTFELPATAAGSHWLRVVATWQEPPCDLLERGAEEVVEGETVTVPDHACVLLRSGGR
ncbi:MAG TPA: isoamylase [Thermoanaerobaculia bacterium]|jgi:glycogen operon protein|nr:isoamylase [Thermoanaerobaculia bacterium]